MIRRILSWAEKSFQRLFWSSVLVFLSKLPDANTNPSAYRSILVLRPDRLGDFVLSLQAMRNLETQAGPNCRLTIVAGKRNAPFAKFFFPKARVKVFHNHLLGRLFLWVDLLAGRYDVVVDFHSYPFSTSSALMAVASRSPRRVGFWDEAWAKELSRQVFNWGVSPNAEKVHESAKSLALAARVFPGTKLEKRSFKPPSAPAPIETEVSGFYKEMGVQGKDLVVGLHPTLGKKDNRWEPDRYVELAGLLGKKKVKLVVVHGLGEERELEDFKRSSRNIQGLVYLPSSDLLTILEAAKRFSILVCGDSGIMHACALVTRVFAIFGPSDPSRWGPLPVHRNRVFRGRDHRCDSVKPNEIARAVSLAVRPGMD